MFEKAEICNFCYLNDLMKENPRSNIEVVPAKPRGFDLVVDGSTVSWLIDKPKKCTCLVLP
jgi:hypothetical protein